MPRVTKAHKKESIVSFSNDAMKVINENLNLNDTTTREDKPNIECDGWYYYVHKEVIYEGVIPEIRVRRQNYRQGSTEYFKDQPKGNRINEEAWIYKEGMNCLVTLEAGWKVCTRHKDHGYLINGFSVQNYNKRMF